LTGTGGVGGVCFCLQEKNPGKQRRTRIDASLFIPMIVIIY
jgi:hypothetical protein